MNLKSCLVILSFLFLSQAIWPQPNSIKYETQDPQIIDLSNFKLDLYFKEDTSKENQNGDVLKKFYSKFTQYQDIIFKKLNNKTKEMLKSQMKIIDQTGEKLYTKQQKTYQLQLEIEDLEYFRINSKTDESYDIIIGTDKSLIKANNYFGFLRAIETFSQIIETDFKILNAPITISDSPYLQYRGIMLDCARHFMPVETILRTIDGMQYNKLNVLHLHLADDESFPLYISEEPEITQTGAFNSESIYSLQDIQTILAHGNQAGVRIIPEIDSPSHARSWALMEKYANCNILCPGSEHYNGQLDITLDLTYELVEKVIDSTQNLFTDEYIHLGGDEVINSCYDKRPSIKTWMAKNNIETKDYIGLQQYYRSKQKGMLNSDKSPIYWCNEDLNIPPTKDQILQYWGEYDNLDMLLSVPNKIIISASEKLYINTGQGFVFGNTFGTYVTWKTVYDFEPIPPKFTTDRILGAEVCLWSEVNNAETVDNNLWIRSSALAERLWTKQKDTTENLVSRLDDMQKSLVSRGIQASPVTSQFCAKYPSKCF